MKKARLSPEGKIIELFDRTGIEKKFHPDFLKTLINVPDDAELDEYIVGGKRMGKRPDDESIIENGQWAKDPHVVERKKQEKKENEARARLKQNLAGIADPALKVIIKDILILLRASADGD